MVQAVHTGGLAWATTIEAAIEDAFADSTPECGVPLGGQTKIDLPNNHLSYIVTWYDGSTGAVSLRAVAELFCKGTQCAGAAL